MKLTKNFDFCEACRLSYTYPIMLLDDTNTLRVMGEPEDKCGTCNKCHICCCCSVIAANINECMKV